MWRAYGRILASNPLLTQMSHSAMLWSAGDVAAQLLESKNNRTVDLQRVGIQSAYAGLIWAPLAHFWYENLDKFVRRLAAAQSMKFVGLKLGLEMALLHPISLLAFFSCVGVASGDSTTEISHQLQRDFIPTLSFEWILWTPLDLANFIFVPVRHQLLVVNCGCFVESIALSFIKANGIIIPGQQI